MKKLTAIVLIVAVLAMGLTAPATAQDGTTIDKAMPNEGDLGDHITVTLTVEVEQIPVTVTDTLPDELTYIPGTFAVDSVPATPSVDGQEISYEFDTVGSYEITFDAQVTSVEAGNITRTNHAEVANATDVLDSVTADITLHPYEGFRKEVVDAWLPDGTSIDPANVPVETDVTWHIGLGFRNITGDQIDVMVNPVVKDNLGGDLEVDLWDTYVGETIIKFSGKTKKAHLTWKNLRYTPSDNMWVMSDLYISTDVNPGTGNGKKPGHQEYTEEGEHYLNSGAVIKFFDGGPGGTGFQLSAHTPPILVNAYVPAP